ncbi:Uncharacterised protein [Candidatus Bilamarchaeum dharawalense]|uniref:Uncharacterized protein n=1 Tax=Candidatus Bilamarchaeum dharawalense TaxID=2885759 RepID=A0A5E4LRN6_9ARCH|nr:Uncharacterised protein [Candidatus Bilamarchaeum dharawalense]
MVGTRVTRSDDKHLNSHSETHSRGFIDPGSRRWWRTAGITGIVLFETLFGGTFMSTTLVRPAAAQEQRMDEKAVEAQRRLTQAVTAITTELGLSAGFGIANPTLPLEDKLVSGTERGKEGLLALIQMYNEKLRPLNGGRDIIPITGTTPQEQLASLNTWLGSDFQACSTCKVFKPVPGLAPDSINMAAAEQLAERIASLFGAPGAFIAAVAVTEGGSRPLPAGPILAPKLAFTSQEYDAAVADLTLISQYPETAQIGQKASTQLAELQRLYGESPQKTAALNESYDRAGLFIGAHRAKSEQLKGDALARERKRADLSPVQQAEQAYYQDTLQKAMAMAKAAQAALASFTEPSGPAAQARTQAAFTIDSLVLRGQALLEKGTLTADEVTQFYNSTMLAADAVQTMDVLMRFAQANGLDRLAGGAARDFWAKYSAVMRVIADRTATEQKYDEALGGFYKSLVERVAQNVEVPAQARATFQQLAQLRATRAGFYETYFYHVQGKGEELSLDTTQKMVDKALDYLEKSGVAHDDPLLEKARQWRASCQNPMVLYTLAHGLVSIREAELWASDGAKSLRPDLSPTDLQAAKQRIELARKAFLWNFNNPQLDPTYYPNMSTVLADDAIHTLVPALRFTEGSAGFDSRFEFRNPGGREKPLAEKYAAATKVEEYHLRLLLALRTYDLSDPLRSHLAKEEASGSYAQLGLFSRLSATEKFDSGLPKLPPSPGRVYLIDGVADMNVAEGVDHDAPGYSRYGLAYAVLRREAVLVGDPGAAALLKDIDLKPITAKLLAGGTEQEALDAVADIRIQQLERRLATVVERRRTIGELPALTADPKTFYIVRAQQALAEAKLLRTQGGTLTSKRAIEVAELGLESLIPPHIPALPAIRTEYQLMITKIDTIRRFGNTYISADATVAVAEDGVPKPLPQYEQEQGERQRIQYNWQFYTKPGYDGNYYLVNPNFGKPGEPEFIGKVVRGLQFSDGTTGDAVVAIQHKGEGWKEVAGPDGGALILYRLKPAPAHVEGTAPATEQFVPLTEGDGSIMAVLSTVSVRSLVPSGHVQFKGTLNSETNAGLVLTPVE